jgi:hypothetical protein
MMKGRYDWTARSAALGAIAVLALGGAACGSDDSSEKPASGDAAAKEATTKPAPRTGEERRIEVAYESLLDALYSGNGVAACALMTPQARDKFGASTDTTCEKRVKEESGKLSKLRPKVISMRVQGSRAVIRAGSANTFKYPVPFAKVGGEWKVSGGF